MGHTEANCGYKRTLTKYAADMDVKFEWGMMKSIFYDAEEAKKTFKCGCKGKKKFEKKY